MAAAPSSSSLTLGLFSYILGFAGGKQLLTAGRRQQYREDLGDIYTEHADGTPVLVPINQLKPERLEEEDLETIRDWISAEIDNGLLIGGEVPSLSVRIIAPHPFRVGSMFVSRTRLTGLSWIDTLLVLAGRRPQLHLDLCEDFAGLIRLSVASNTKKSPIVNTLSRHGREVETLTSTGVKVIARFSSRHPELQSRERREWEETPVLAEWTMSNGQGKTSSWRHENAIELVRFALAHEAAHVAGQDIER